VSFAGFSLWWNRDSFLLLRKMHIYKEIMTEGCQHPESAALDLLVTLPSRAMKVRPWPG
jgi:hypothetical protein